MVEIREVDIFESKCKVIVHNVNCKGYMGRGIAKSIKERYPDTYLKYVEVCNKSGNRLLGKVLYDRDESSGVIIANIFGQESVGLNSVQLDRSALLRGLIDIELNCRKYGVGEVAVPYGIGCGNAGGDWEEVYKDIKGVFGRSEVTCVICKLCDIQI